MKKRMISGVVLMCIMCLLLAGCQKKSSGNVASESRSGVARVLSIYGNCTLYYYNPYTGESGIVATGIQYAVTGSAFGVGAAGKETDTFVTNRHVVANLSYDVVAELEGGYLLATGKLTQAYLLKDDYAYNDDTGLDRSRAIPCDVIYKAPDDSADIAVLKAAEPMPGRVALPLLAEGHDVQSGDTVYALGYPGSTDDINDTYAASVERVTVTSGVVSLHSQLTQNDVKINIIQHTAQVNHGNSGGPLIDANGAVVGVNTFIWGQNDSTGDSASSGSVEIYYVRDVLDSLKIKYDVYPSGGVNTVLVIVLAAAAVLIIAAVVVVVMVRRKPAPVPVPVPGPDAGVPFTPTNGPVQPPVSPVIAGDTGLRIQGISGRFASRRFAIPGTLRIGRDPARNDLVYPADSQGVSGVHCVLTVEGGRLLLRDLGSTYGTFVGGNRLAANASMELRVGDRFCLGSERETFVIARKGEV